MTLWEIVRFEVGYQSRRPSTWFYGTLLLLVTWYVSAEISTDYARSSGTFVNDPFFIAEMALLGCLVGLLMAAAIAGDAATRDIQTRMDALVATTPAGRAMHMAGRLLAAFGLYATCLLVVPLALGLVSMLADPALVGPFRPAAYLHAYLFLLLPNALIATSLLFAMAALSRRAIVSYAGAVLVFTATLASYLFVALVLQNWTLAAIIDPMGGVALGELGRLWTPAERGTRLIGLHGALLWNRLLWTGVALGVLALTGLWIRRAHHSESPATRRAQRHGDEPAVRHAPVRVPRRVERSFGLALHLRQALAVARESFVTIVTGWGGLAMLAVAAMVVANGTQLTHLGVPFVATTERMLSVQSHAALVWLLVIFAAGELVWRERDARLGEIAGAAPVPEWASFLGRFVGLSLVLVLVQGLVMGAAMSSQALLGHRHVELSPYGRALFGLQLVNYLLIAVLALAVHVIVNHKYVAHALVTLAVMLVPARHVFGLDHNLLVYSADPDWTYSDMRGFEPFVTPWLWFNLYWAAWALLLAFVATVFWVRGAETGLGGRMALARRRLTPRTAAAAAVAGTLVLAIGGFIFYNTNVLNAYETASEIAGRRAEYERRYGQYRAVPQPQLTSVTLAVEIFPARRTVEIEGTFVLENDAGAPIERVHVATPPGVDVLSLEFDRTARSASTDDGYGHRIYALERALQPGESVRLRFAVRRAPHGFRNDGVDASVVANGTYFRIEQWLPAIGYQPERELRTASERRAFGLPERPPMAVLHDVEARHDSARAAKAAFEAVVGTNDGQMAIAPGSLRRTWTRDGRRYFHYVADAPIGRDYAFFSADYAVREVSSNDVTIQVVHHPGHGWNADRMADSARASLESYAQRFGRRYPHRVLRIVEHPGDSVVLHASPINISYEEPVALLNPAADPRSIDLPFAVTAHEVAHQWWGHMVTPARVEGAALLGESLAWYSALSLVEDALGPDHVRRLLQMMREAYLLPQPRGNVPLLRADDWFLAYRKGPFAMWALRQYLGAEKVDAVLRTLVDRYGTGEPPLPTSLDLYRELQAVTPEPLRYLLVDLFEANTYWDLATQRVTATEIGNGQWQVTLDVLARKSVVDEDGVETEVPMNDLIQVGVFAESETEPQYLQMHRVRSGHQRIIVTVSAPPTRAGVDPAGLLVDLDAPNNSKEITR